VKDAVRLPLNLLDALRMFDENEVLKGKLGSEFSSAYLTVKHQEWNAHAAHISQWERVASLDV